MVRPCWKKWVLMMKPISIVFLILLLLAGCQASRQTEDSSLPSKSGVTNKDLSETMQNDIDELMSRYIIPYEYFSGGQNWDYDDPDYAYPYDPDDIFSRQISIDYPVEGFALGVIVRELPEQTRQSYIYTENDTGVGYNVTGQLWDTVSRFYFGIPASDPCDNPHAENMFEGGLPQYPSENEGLSVSFGEMQMLENGDVRVMVDRVLDGRPILSCEYTLRPFIVEDVPTELDGVFHPGNKAYRFVRVVDVPHEAERKTVEIRTAEDLRALSHTANSGDPAYLKTTFLLMNDIDMEGEVLEPIGQFVTRNYHDSNSDGFNAVFDGQGHVILNLKIHVIMDGYGDCQGLPVFGFCKDHRLSRLGGRLHGLQSGRDCELPL